MIKKITIEQLTIGMYVHDLNIDWMSHPFLRQRFQVEDDGDLSKIRASGVRDLYIDTERGLDVADAPTEAEVRKEVEQRMLKAAGESPPPPVSTAEEMDKARKVYEQAGNLVRTVMRDVRLGRAVEVAEVEAVVEDISWSLRQ